MIDTLMTISVISFIATGVFAILAVILWFVFKIPSVMGDLSGRTAKKSIELMRQNNEKTGVKSYRSSKENLRRGKLTSAIKESDKNKKEVVETALLNENMKKNHVSNATELLLAEEKTEPLDMVTAALDDDLSEKRNKISSISIKLLEEIMYIHTKEVI